MIAGLSKRSRTAVVPLTLVLLTVLFTGLLPMVASADHGIAKAERSIDRPSLAPGASTAVTTTVTVHGSGSALTIDEQADTAFGSIEFDPADGDLQHRGEAFEPDLSVVEDDVLVVGLQPDGGFESGDTVTLRYTVTAPEDPDAGAIRFDGESALDDYDPVAVAGNDTVSFRGAGGDANGDSVPFDLVVPAIIAVAVGVLAIGWYVRRD